MFYSHAILTSREHGIATVWLVATLGSRSSLRTVTRRKILDVDVHRACDTIRNPGSPMALRLQGNLLYGVARVYSQQCDYVLGDAQSVRDKVRGASIVVKELALDPEVGRARPDQLNLPDDPAFTPNFDISVDLLAFDLPPESSGRSSLLSPPSLISSRSSQHTVERDEAIEEPGLEIPPGDSSFTAGLPGFDQGLGPEPGIGSVGRTPGISVLGDETGIVDVGWEFDEHGNMIETGQRPKSATNIASTGRIRATGLTPDSAISARVRQEHAEGLQAAQQAEDNGFYLGDGMLGLGEDEQVLADTRPFSPRNRADEAGSAQPPVSTSPSEPAEEETPSTALSAAQRRAPALKLIEPDPSPGLTNGQLRQWDQSYIENMQEAGAAKLPYRVARQAKKNAQHWVIGHGIGGVGSGLGQDHVQASLQAFSGARLLATLTGRDLSSAGSKHGRSRSMTSIGEDEERRVRAREETTEHVSRGGPDQELALTGQGEDGIFVVGDEMDVELGRAAAVELPERLSSQMPWDIYSVPRHGPDRRLEDATAGLTSSVGGPGRGFELGPPSAISQRGSRLTSASPLQGRGRPLPLSQRISIVSSITDGEGFATSGVYGDEDDLLLGRSEAPALDHPAAAATAATRANAKFAAQEQLAAAGLDSESRNFLDYLDARIQATEGVPVAEETEHEEGGQDRSSNLGSTFESLIPAEHTKEVAAQAFVHVLTLASKNLIRVRQEESFADIDIELAIAV